MTTEIKCLDHGFVKLLNISGPVRRTITDTTVVKGTIHFGGELDFDADITDIAKVARISFDNFDKDRTREMDLKLCEYLLKNNHTSPWEMIEVWFEMKMPIFVARQSERHRTSRIFEGITEFDCPSINEVSGRYAVLPEEWYIPEIVGGKPTNGMKQGQEDNLCEDTQNWFKYILNTSCKSSYDRYEQALSYGVAAEHARLFLHVNHYCVAVDTLILRQDLTWVKAGDLNKGDKLLGFEEYGSKSKKRRYIPSTITEFSIQEDSLYELQLSNRESIKCNAEHKWLVRYKTGGMSRWVTTKELKLNPTQWVMLKLFDTWETQTNYDWGFLAASFDGEGYLTYTNNNGKALGFTQNENPMLIKVRKLLDKYEYSYTEQTNNISDTKNLRLTGGLSTILEFLGKARSPRLLEKWEKDTDGGIRVKDTPEILSINSIGVGKIASMSTSSKTYIANGYPSHNTHWVWKQDLSNLLHFLSLRLHSHAQVEARVYAQAIYDLLKINLPDSMELFDKYRRL
jgi:thymidylate synthase (FAD)